MTSWAKHLVLVQTTVQLCNLHLVVCVNPFHHILQQAILLCIIIILCHGARMITKLTILPTHAHSPAESAAGWSFASEMSG